MTATDAEFTGDATPTQILRSRIEELESELKFAMQAQEAALKDWDGMKCALFDCKSDFEKALPKLAANYPNSAVTFQIRSRIEMLRILIASKDLR